MNYCKRCYLEKVNPEAKLENLIYSEAEAKCDCCGQTRLIVDKYENDDDYMSIAECNEATRDHIEKVRKYIKIVTDILTQRGIDHDASKLREPEVDGFAKNTKRLARLKFYNENGEVSDEYKESLKDLESTLECHYANNRHHPEHFPDGIEGMDLIDLVEMLCDWKASTLRQNNGNLLMSIEANAKRFGISKQLTKILVNTASYIDR